MCAILRGEISISRNGIARPGWILAAHVVVAVTARDVILLVQSVIDTAIERPRVIGDDSRKDVVLSPRPTSRRPKRNWKSNVRIGEKRSDLGAHRIDASRLNDVSRHAAGLARYGRIIERVLKLSKVPLLHQWSGNCALYRRGTTASETLQVEEEEGFVLDDGTAERASKLILRETALWLTRSCVIVCP